MKLFSFKGHIKGMCDYVYPRQCGRRCGLTQCKSHEAKRADPKQQCYSQFVGDRKVLNASNVLQTIAVAPHLAADALKYLFDAFELIGLAQSLKIPRITQKSAKNTTATAIASLGQKIATVAQSPMTLHALIAVQRKWRDRLHGRTLGTPNNAEDPFTLTPLSEIPESQYIAYRDTTPARVVWGFSAPDLYYHIVSNTATNPFTRDELPEEFIRRVGIVMSRSPQEMRHFSLNSCATVDQLYTYVLGLYELEGFYLCNEWFIALSPDDLGLVSRLVRGRMDPLATTQTVQTSSSHHEFGELMLSIVNSQSNTRFATMCFLVTTVARLLPEMEESLPEWVFAAALGAANAQ
jgi:hypothetical protein